MAKILSIFLTGLLFTLVILAFPYSLPSTNAQTAAVCPGKNATGLLSAPNISGFGTSSGACNQDPSSAFAPYKIPTYDDLKSLYYTQSKSNKTPISGAADQSNLSATIDTVYSITGDLDISGNPPPGTNGTFVVFVGGNLNIRAGKFTYGNENSGIVFIVKGNVYIAYSVTQIDAVIISSGTIYTASPLTSSSCAKNAVTTSQLTINGSLISMYQDSPQATTCSVDPVKAGCPNIVFCRSLAINDRPSELINHQVKYLVILRNLMSDTLQRWSEIP